MVVEPICGVTATLVTPAVPVVVTSTSSHGGAYYRNVGDYTHTLLFAGQREDSRDGSSPSQWLLQLPHSQVVFPSSDRSLVRKSFHQTLWSEET